MKSPDEIKKGLECCSISYADCNNECPYKPDCDGSQILKDALALIQQLQAENADQAVRIQQLEKRAIHLEALNQSNLTTITMQERTRARFQERISQLEAERDALMHYLHSMGCDTCLYDDYDGSEPPCINCTATRDLWQFQGVQKEE